MSEDEAIKRLIEMKQDIQEDINRVEDYVNTGADEEKVQAIETILDLYQKEKEKNKEAIQKAFEDGQISIVNRYISKDKIRAKIKELEGQEDWYREHNSLDDLYGRIDELKELLEEN